MKEATLDELRRLKRMRAAGFEDATLTELRYEALVEQDTRTLRAAAHSNPWRRSLRSPHLHHTSHQTEGEE